MELEVWEWGYRLQRLHDNRLPTRTNPECR